MTFNKTAILAIAAAVILTASAIGLAYAFSASTGNSDNTAPTAYLTINQTDNEYYSNFDDNTIVFDSMHGYMKDGVYVSKDTADASLVKSYKVKEVIKIEDGTVVDAASMKLTGSSSTDWAISALGTGDSANIFLLGDEEIQVDVVGMTKTPVLYLNVDATGLTTTTGAGFNYFIQWVGTVGDTQTKVFQVAPANAGDATGTGYIQIPAITLGTEIDSSGDVDIRGTLSLFVQPNWTLDDALETVPESILNSTMFTISLLEEEPTA